MSCNVIQDNQVTYIDTKQCYLFKANGSGYQTAIFPKGSYKVELWGASGSSRTIPAGKGGYTSGYITFEEDETTMYFYIGTKGEDAIRNTPGNGGYNGGAKGGIDTNNQDCASGGSGGATDMRTKKGIFSNQESLISRIMVAGGGGSSGCEYGDGKGGNAGGLTGESGSNALSDGTGKGGTAGSQIAGFSFGIGEEGKDGDEASGAGGGGYFGGHSGEWSGLAAEGAGGGGGGSSFISGYKGCIDKSTQSAVSELYTFSKPIMIAGNQTMPLPDGNNGIWDEINGAFRLTYLSFRPNTCKKQRYTISFSFIFEALTSVLNIKV